MVKKRTTKAERIKAIVSEIAYKSATVTGLKHQHLEQSRRIDTLNDEIQNLHRQLDTELGAKR